MPPPIINEVHPLNHFFISGHGMVFIAPLSSPFARQGNKYTFLLRRNCERRSTIFKEIGDRCPLKRNRCDDGLMNEQGGMVFDKKRCNVLKL